ncbi:hypothetical protein SISSUDRAFT_664692 [Sistotremastrum suecicum HHB10207 ss-3]|uniref:SMODS and SLOG-associating 2TM effector domain-containing protein n=1 Tax=Sistotremastrum suecicum HHB10207 ss-3 TaxID=1314776 RepID=A0A165X2F7_9AGAM|nr:hypothetical protein SISSUDRAFT_664692 [Sistotremastrum suecicum HHB10207 ss-3]
MYQGSSRSKLTRAHIFYRYILLVHSFTNSITSFQFQSQGPVQPLSVEERLQPTLDTALQHQKQYSTQATAYAVVLNVCITLQILLGAMITALAAVASKHAGATTAVLGACSTLVATYLAKARSGGEPESSRGRSTELEKLIREIQAFILDFGKERPRLSAATFVASSSSSREQNDGNSTQRQSRPERSLTVDAVKAHEAQEFLNAKDKWLDARIERFRQELEKLQSSFNGRSNLFTSNAVP